MNRRTWIAAAAGVGAAAAGLGTWAWRSGLSDGGPDLWSLSLDTPEGGSLALASLRGRPLVVNFWATWCPPCVREMPAIDRFHREFEGKGWQVLGIAADNAPAVQKFLAATPVGFKIAVAGFPGVELSRRLGNLSGGLPFTVIFDRAGEVAHRHMGETQYDQLRTWAQAIP